MELTHELREHAGLQWVLERLSPLSPFGKTLARALRWYGPGQEEALEEEFDNITLAMELWGGGDTALRGVTRQLPLFHDIRGSLDREPGVPFDLVELFEIKHFLVTLEQLTQAYGQMPPMKGLVFPDLGEARSLW